MKKVTAKFTCTNVTVDATPTPCYTGNNAQGQPEYTEVTAQTVQLYPITAGGPDRSAEDALFAASTPSGQFWMRVMNDAIRQADFFVPGKQYRITIEPDAAEEAPAAPQVEKPSAQEAQEGPSGDAQVSTDPQDAPPPPKPKGDKGAK